MSSPSPIPNKRILMKSVLVGDAEVGKSSISHRYVNGRIATQYKATIGADFQTIVTVVEGTEITNQIWDTAGQDGFRSLGASFYKGADVFVFVYDSNKLKSYENLKSLLTDVDKLGVVNPIKILVANKSDLNHEHQVVSRKTAMQFKESHKFDHFVEVSAKDGTNIVALFDEINRLVLNRAKQKDNQIAPVPAVHPAVQPFLPKIETYTGKLQREIDGCGFFVNRTRKQHKIDGFNLLKSSQGNLDEALQTVEDRYPEFLKGRNTKKLIKEIQTAATSNGSSITKGK
jgi:Ras-related protein Rab-7A